MQQVLLDALIYRADFRKSHKGQNPPGISVGIVLGHADEEIHSYSMNDVRVTLPLPIAPNRRTNPITLITDLFTMSDLYADRTSIAADSKRFYEDVIDRPDRRLVDTSPNAPYKYAARMMNEVKEVDRDITDNYAPTGTPRTDFSYYYDSKNYVVAELVYLATRLPDITVQGNEYQFTITFGDQSTRVVTSSMKANDRVRVLDALKALRRTGRFR